MKRGKRRLVGLLLVAILLAVGIVVWNKNRGWRPNVTADLGGGVTLGMVWIPGGSFDMGSGPTMFERAKRTVAKWFGKTVTYPYRADESPVHEVRLAGFWMGKCEVTQAQWEAVMGSNPSRFKGEDLPVDNVSWLFAAQFCRKLSERTSMTFVLPSEAQWEYACRPKCQLSEAAWFMDNSESKTHPVGQKRPNAFGLYDMQGNLWEWCQDEWHFSYVGAPTDGSAWEALGGPQRVLRGGAWLSAHENCDAPRRGKFYPNNKSHHFGLRVVRNPE